MSDKHIQRVLKNSPYSEGKKLLHVCIAAAADETGEATFKMKDMAEQVGVTENTISNRIAEMLEDGYLVKTKRITYNLEWPGNKPMTSAELLAARRKPQQLAKVERPEPERHPTTILAQKLVKERYDAEEAKTGKKPVWSFPGTLAMVKSFLEGGHTPEDVEYMLREAPVFSKAAFQFALAKRDKPARRDVSSALDDWDKQIRGSIR